MLGTQPGVECAANCNIAAAVPTSQSTQLQHSLQDGLVGGLPEDPLSQAKDLRLVGAVILIMVALSGTACAMRLQISLACIQAPHASRSSTGVL